MGISKNEWFVRHWETYCRRRTIAPAGIGGPAPFPGAAGYPHPARVWHQSCGICAPGANCRLEGALVPSVSFQQPAPAPPSCRGRRTILSHSHIPVLHLVRQAELHRERAMKHELPGWLLTFIDRATDSFEPYSGVARVGYEAAQSDDGAWEVSLFLGENEMIGGPDDGCLVPVNFRFKIDALQDCFSTVQRCEWNVFPNLCGFVDDTGDLSFLLMDGVVDGNPLRLQVHAAPPETVGPAMRFRASGEYELL